MSLIKQSTARALPILMVDATDGYTEETGLTLTITVRKAGSSTWSASAGSTVERGNGSYEYTPSAGEVDTLGVFEYRATAAGARTYRGACQVVAELPGLLATGAITAAVIATDAIDSDAIAATAVSEIQSGLATAAALAAVQADTDDIQTRLPAALVGGRIDASVGAMAAGVVTAAAIATNAIDADALATDAVTELQSGLATASAVAALPTAAGIADAVWDEARAGHVAAGSFGEGVASVQGAVTGAVASVTAGVTLAANAVSAAAVAADAVAELQAGLATSAALSSAAADAATAASAASAAAASAASVDGKLTSTRAGYLDAAITSRAPSTLTDASIAAQVDTVLTAAHGASSWQAGSGGADAATIAAAVADQTLTGHSTAGTVGGALAGAATSSALSAVSAAIAALPSASDVAAAVLAATLEGAHTVAGGLRLLLAVAAGRRTVSGTTHTYRDLGNTKNRVVSTVDSSGNRAAASTADGT